MSEATVVRTYKPDDPIKVYFELTHSDATAVQVGFELESDVQPDCSRLIVGFDVGDLLPISNSAEKQTIMSEGRIPGTIVGGIYSLFLHFDSAELNSRYVHSGFAIRIESDEKNAAPPVHCSVSRIDVS